jgi:hypothetical protein
MSNLQSNVQVVLNNIQCGPVQYELFLALNTGVCGNTLSGLYAIILCYFVITTSLYFVMMASGVLWQYFQLKFWNSKASYYGNEVLSPFTIPPSTVPLGQPPATIAPPRRNEV